MVEIGALSLLGPSWYQDQVGIGTKGGFSKRLFTFNFKLEAEFSLEGKFLPKNQFSSLKLKVYNSPTPANPLLKKSHLWSQYRLGPYNNEVPITTWSRRGPNPKLSTRPDTDDDGVFNIVTCHIEQIITINDWTWTWRWF